MELCWECSDTNGKEENRNLAHQYQYPKSTPYSQLLPKPNQAVWGQEEREVLWDCVQLLGIGWRGGNFCQKNFICSAIEHQTLCWCPGIALIYYGCRNKAPPARWLEQQKCIFSQLWRMETLRSRFWHGSLSGEVLRRVYRKLPSHCDLKWPRAFMSLPLKLLWE